MTHREQPPDDREARLAAIAIAVLDWQKSCDDGPDTDCGKAMAEIWRYAMGDPEADLWADERAE